MDNAKKNKLETLTKITVSQLEQIMFISIAIWFSRENICRKAKEIDENADEIILPYNKNIAVSTLATIRKKNPELFEVDGIGKEKGFGHFSNKMTIVSIAAAIEGYFSECAKKILETNNIPYSFERLITKIHKEKNIDLRTINEYQEVSMIFYTRHKIVHTLGKVDDIFIDKLTPVTGEVADFLKSKDINIGDQVEIPIDRFILPCISNSISFS